MRVTSTAEASASTLRRLVAHPLPLWIAFVVVHLVVGAIALGGEKTGYPLGDVEWVYTLWTREGLGGAGWVGIDKPFVYPLLALVPMLIARIAGEHNYAAGWLSLIMLLNAGAFAMLLGTARDRVRAVAGWWWLAFLLALGPIALGRIDSVTVPLSLAGLLLLAAHPRVAIVVLTLAAWMKVWPAALVGAILVAAPHRLRTIGYAVGTSVVIILIALILGSGANVLSFVTEQGDRGLQVEAPVSSFWMWDAAAHRPGGSSLYYDNDLLTYQLRGPGVEVASAVMTPLLVVVVLVVLAVAVLALRRGATTAAVLPPLALAVVMALICFQKVGSPQFVSWIAVPVAFGLVARAAGGPSFRVPAVAALAIAGLTQGFYPYLYGWFLSLDPALLLVFTLRNALDVVLLVWAVVTLLRAHRATASPGESRVSALGEAPTFGSAR
ncbi:glycosyltransferase family 87 protein [Schumannella luteola]